MIQFVARRHVTVSTRLGEEVLQVRRLTGTEELGRLFQVELELLSENEQIALEDVLGEPMTVHFHRNRDETRHVNGLVSRFEYVETSGRHARYRATLRPWLWFLTRSADCRIFQGMTAPDIVKEVFRDHGFADFEDALTGCYRVRDYCVQYRETAFDFVSRLMEEEGIYYSFRHEEDRHFLVLADSSSAHRSCPGYEEVPFRPSGQGPVNPTESVFGWSIAQEVKPGRYALNDYDFERPRARLEVRSSSPRRHVHSEFEIYDYPGNYAEVDDGDRYARTRLEGSEAEFEQAEGATDARGLTAGGLFTLIEHPREDQNREYLVVSTSYELDSPPGECRRESEAAEPTYACRFKAIDSRLAYRPARRTVKPVVQGPQTAVVVGKSGEEIWTDEAGRVKVQFHWDREGAMDETSSCWIRVSQAWAGKGYGAVTIPRVGQEVIVEFLEGDPDRPIVTGRVHNAVQTPPFPLPAAAMVSGIRTHSLQGEGGYNEISFDDTHEAEKITVRAQYDHDTTVLHDQKNWIHNDRHLAVKRDHLETVERDRHASTQRHEHEEIGRDHHRKVGGKEAIEVAESRSLTVRGDVIEVFHANHSEQVSGSCYIKAANTVIEATGGLTLKAGGSFITLNASGVAISGPLVMINSGGAPLSGTPGTAVAPAAPRSALTPEEESPEADAAPWHQEPGEEDEEGSWIEIELLDEADQPVAGERYRIILPDGETAAEGTTDAEGLARVRGIDPGTCQITFPDLDGETWERM